MKPGDSVPVTLVFEGADKTRESVQVKATVKAMAGAAGPIHKH